MAHWTLTQNLVGLRPVLPEAGSRGRTNRKVTEGTLKAYVTTHYNVTQA